MQRLRLFLILGGTVVLVVVLFLVFRPDDDSGNAAATTSTPTGPTRSVSSPSSTRPMTSATEPEPSGPTRIEITVRNAAPVGGIVRAKVDEGDQVVIVVDADVSDEIHLHGYDLSADVAPGAPARLEFRATIPGRFEVELEERSRQIAEIEVEP
jgi:hypothetical protein